MTTPPAWGEPRSKTVTWFDPLAAAALGRELSGMEHLQAIVDGVLPPPPIATLFGFSLAEIAPNEVVFECTPDESAYNPIGLVHGGLVCTLLDSALGCAVQTTLPAGVGYTNIEIKINYLRGVHGHTGVLRARGVVTKPGRRVAFADGEVRDGDGRLVATGTGSCLILSA